jgi:hypothetical protein
LSVSYGVSAVQPIGHPITISSNSGKHIEPITVPRKGLLLPPHSSIRPIVLFVPPFTPLGVGSENPDSFAEVVKAGFGRSVHSPLRIEPERGQVSENDSKPSRSECWAVFHEDVSWSHLANDSGHLAPEAAARAIDADALSRRGDVLTGKPSRNHVNNASPWPPVESSHVRPNWEWPEKSIGLPLRENGCAVGITFNRADGPPAQQVSAENSSTSAREKSQLIHALAFMPSPEGQAQARRRRSVTAG